MNKKDVEAKRERNRIYRVIEAAGAKPAEFEWVRDEVLRHRKTKDYYDFEQKWYSSPGEEGNKYYTDADLDPETGTVWNRDRRMKIHLPKMIDGERQPELQFEEWIKTMKAWLDELDQYESTPDLWSSISQERALSTAASAILENRPFAAAEQRLIAAKLDEIKAYLLDGQQFAAEEAETVEREFTYLRESSERLGKKDWLNNLLGGLVGLAICLALDPEKATGLLRLAGAVFQSLWGTGHNLLPQ